MSNIFWAMSKDGKFSMGTEHNAIRFREFLKKNPNMRFKIDPLTPESNKQRAFFEGAVIPLITYYQEGFDYNSYEDCKTVRDWLKTELNGEFKVIAGHSVKVAKSTKGELNKGFLERVLDWMQDNGYQTELLLPEDYKKWRDEIFPWGGPENYIDYLLETKKLKPKQEHEIQP